MSRDEKARDKKDGGGDLTSNVPSSSEDLNVQQRLMRHPVLLCILIPAIVVTIYKLTLHFTEPALGPNMAGTLEAVVELALLIVIILWMKHGTGITLGYTTKHLGKALLLIVVPVLAFCLMNVINTFGVVAQGGEITGGAILLALLWGMAPGFFEEYALRGLGVTSMMDVWRDKSKVIVMSAFFSALIFGLLHFSNFLNGDILGTLAQMIYAVGIGVMFAGTYLRTHNLLACSIFHTLIDTSAFLNDILRNSMGATTSLTTDMTSFLFEVGMGLVMLAIGFFLIRRKKQDEIRALWYPADEAV